MINMKCEIVRDLIPLYIDEVCSEESIYEIKKHFKNCDKCKLIFEKMNKEIDIPLNYEELLEVKKPFNIIKKKNRFNIIFAIMITVVFMSGIYFVVQNVGIINNIVFPKRYAVIREENDINTYTKINIEKEDFLNFDSSMFNKEITNNANSEVSINLRITDEYNNTLLDNIIVEPGETYDLKELKTNKNYILKAKHKKGDIFLTIS